EDGIRDKLVTGVQTCALPISELASEHPTWAFVNVNLRTYYAEGSKTLAFETVEQLGWQPPDHVVVPVASGSQLTKIAKGFEELEIGRASCRERVWMSGVRVFV